MPRSDFAPRSPRLRVHNCFAHFWSGTRVRAIVIQRQGVGTLLRLFRTIAISAVLGLVVSSAQADPQALTPQAAARAWRQAHEKAIVSDFVTLLAMPDVATNLADVDKNAAYIEGQLKARGFETQLLRAAPGTPRVCLRRTESSRRETHRDLLCPL